MREDAGVAAPLALCGPQSGCERGVQWPAGLEVRGGGAAAAAAAAADTAAALSAGTHDGRVEGCVAGCGSGLADVAGCGQAPPLRAVDEAGPAHDPTSHCEVGQCAYLEPCWDSALV